jgi:hypothetical protein
VTGARRHPAPDDPAQPPAATAQPDRVRRREDATNAPEGTNSPSVLELAGHLDRLLAAGWEITSSGPSSRGLSVVRIWQAHQSAVIDLIDLRNDGVAEAARHGTDGHRTLWREGPIADVVEAFLIEPAPRGYQARGQSAFLPLGSATSRVEAFFRLRGGWERADGDDTGHLYRYQLGPGSDELDRPRVDQHQALGLMPSWCTVTPDLNVEISAWHVANGCPDHGDGEVKRTEFDNPTFPAILSGSEDDACAADLTALAYCLLFGPCSIREHPQAAPRQELPAVASPARQPRPGPGR